MNAQAYKVLARKYRPTKLSELVGQEALVRVLTGAIDSGRIPHAILFHGIRGVGKTTTARIIARSLNCVKGPVIEPCGVCEQCVGIAEDRNMDVIEMDAASRTGVNDIRELIETVQYLPAAARYKIYIIDEVHMLSNSAFNALLKTLEEPPPHVKFIFATTELKKIPATIISRCMKFDLKRIEHDKLKQHLKNICALENVEFDEDAMDMITKAAEGSARDSLSILDQAISFSEGRITSAMVQEMLGYGDLSQVIELFMLCMEGRTGEALALLRQILDSGTDAASTIQEMMEVCHLATRLKVAGGQVRDHSLPEAHMRSVSEKAGSFSVPALARAWQVLGKGLAEIRFSPAPDVAAEMLVVRLCYMPNLPLPEEIIKSVSAGEPQKAVSRPVALVAQEERPAYKPEPARAEVRKSEQVNTPVETHAHHVNRPKVSVSEFSELVQLFNKNREPILYSQLKNDVRLVRMEDCRLEINCSPDLPKDFCGKVAKMLAEWTGNQWNVVNSAENGAETLAERDEQEKNRLIQKASQNPVVRKVLDDFPGSEIMSVSVQENA